MNHHLSLPSTPSFRLDKKRALVTGASSGIGLGCAVALAEAGAEVTLAARSYDKLQQISSMLNQQKYHTNPLRMDVCDIDQFDQIVAQYGPFDILANSAGMAIHTLAVESTQSDFDKVFEINVKAAYFLSTAIARDLIKRKKSGTLVHISSQMGHVGGIERSVYCGSKHALEGFIKAMASEWGKYSIRINSICPTFIKTPLTEATFKNPERLKWIMEKIKLERVANVEDVMGALVYLASDASAMVTGSALMVDGGWIAA
ncbi:MAG: SDR family oxidoreductase [Pseudomonadota bacterium]